MSRVFGRRSSLGRNRRRGRARGSAARELREGRSRTKDAGSSPLIPFDPGPVAVRWLYENGERLDLDRETRENPQQNAEGVGFEPTESLRPQRFSRPPHSTALPPLRGNDDAGLVTT